MNTVEFLSAFHPKGPWVLTAISVDRKKIETLTFGPSSATEAEKWVTSYNDKRNLYFHVNTPNHPVEKKCEREDIHEVSWLHVDVDARAGEDLNEELKRIKLLFTTNLPDGIPKPTVLLASGGGYQAFWKLKEPIVIDDLDKAEEMADYNKQLEIVLGGDKCHNIDRIMRLPGTINIPNARKVERGRSSTPALITWFESRLIYNLNEFTKAPTLQMHGIYSDMKPINTANIERIDSLDELDKWKVPDRVKVIIAQGQHPDERKPDDNSRSAWLFDCVCQLVRCDVPDEMIYSIITDPDLDISSSVLDKGPNSDRYANRQIKRAHEEAEEPWLRKLNDRFAVIGSLGGKCRVIEEVYNQQLKQDELHKQAFMDFRNRYMNHFIQVGKKSVPVGHWWLANRNRRYFEKLVFDPSRTEEGTYNLWKGFNCQSIPGNKHEKFLQHIFENVCRKNKDHYDYLIGWMARAVQSPNQSGETAVVLRGKSGTGKSFFAIQFGKLWGRHFLQVSDAKHLVGAFNGHLRECVILFGDEAFYAGDKKHESVLKTLITERKMMIEQKGVDAEVSANFTHLILASNAQWVVPAGGNERRFFVLDVGDKHELDTKYFGEIAKDMREGGRESLLHFLLGYDLSGYNVSEVPSTRALFDQKLFSLSPVEEWWYERLQEGRLLSISDHYVTIALSNDLFNDYIAWCEVQRVNRRFGRIKFKGFLMRVCPEGWPKHKRQNSAPRAYYYEFPPLEKLRESWEDLHKFQVPWQQVDDSIFETEEKDPRNGEVF